MLLYFYLHNTGQVEIMEEKLFNRLLTAQQWSIALLVFNSILDPLIYMSNVRIKLKAFFRGLMCELQHPYDAVQTVEGRREDVPTTHTMVNARSSIQVSGGFNLTPTEQVRAASEC